jgi:two-component system OmpR family response regulator
VTPDQATIPKVLLIDDDAALTAMLTEFLRGEGFETAAAFNGTDGALAALDPDLDAVILDVMMPDISGIETLQRIRSTSAVPVIMLTAKGAEDDRVAGLEMGADDYIAKPYFPRELVARLRAVLRRQREPATAPATLRWGPLELSAGKRELLWNGSSFDLTTSEFDLLECLMRSRDLVSSKEDLSSKVLNRKHESYDRSIDVHVSNLRRKLAEVCGETVEVETIRGIGYRLRVAA